jgi:pimeloyl-ACP methyl ester carboxylesterase
MRASGLGWSGLAVVLGSTASKCQEEPPTFDWTTITPSEDLEWTECYGGVFQCARLEVPYNYENETDTRTMAVALQMLPAVVDIDDPTHGGSIFINPGGPGHPGTDFVMNTGQHLQLTFDIPGEKHYDIIGWDPRGVGNTTPRIQCLDGLFDRDSFYMEHRGTHAYQPNSDNIAYLLASYEGLAAKCKWQHDNNGVDVFEYVSTALVIEDMVRMVDKLDAQRNDAKRKRGLAVRQSDGPARLQYYGVSYGSVIGQFFASMHPERVGRIAIDGIVDVDDFLAERVS